MNKEQAKIILAFAENDMKISLTAKQLHRSGDDVGYHLDKIREQIGWNPRKFYDLCYLVGVAAQRLGGEYAKL
jgi:sugar diacid utilization regulator